MYKVWIGNLLLILAIICLLPAPSYAQLDQLHGDQNYSTYGVHSGNQLRTFFWTMARLVGEKI